MKKLELIIIRVKRRWANNMRGWKEKILNSYQLIPKPVKLFLGMSLAIAVLWKLIYLFIFMNTRIIDAPLTNHVGNSSAYVLNHFSGLHNFSALNIIDTTIMEGQIQITQVSKIVHDNKKVLHIADGCNGLELMVLYSGFILCFPSSRERKMWYILFGVLMIDLFNILRCSLLGFIKEYYHPYFYISHHFLFKAVVYAVIVILWVSFTRKSQVQNAAI
jgi:exosortase/archaeosortase family protein